MISLQVITPPYFHYIYPNKEVRIWKETQESSDYDWAFIKRLTQSLKESRQNGAFMKLMHIIRSNAMRNLANTLNPNLYCESYIGTKHLIENFQNEVIKPLKKYK